MEIRKVLWMWIFCVKTILFLVSVNSQILQMTESAPTSRQIQQIRDVRAPDPAVQSTMGRDIKQLLISASLTI